jgi:matrixin
MVSFAVGAGLLAVLAGGPIAIPAPGLTAGAPLFAAAGTGGVTGPCKQSAHTHNGSHFTKTYRWSFSSKTAPAGLPQQAVERALRVAVQNITHSRNSCGLADRVSATSSYRGRTSSSPNVTRSSTCGKPDGRSEVGFGKLSGTDLGLTCYWTRSGRTVEADIKLNKADYSWYAKKPAHCAKSWSIQAVATHEFGHAFGLNHVSEVTDGALTMSPLILPCQHAETTLGLGDVRGLRSLY